MSMQTKPSMVFEGKRGRESLPSGGALKTPDLPTPFLSPRPLFFLKLPCVDAPTAQFHRENNQVLPWTVKG